MLGNYSVQPTIAVKDLAKAQDFYENTLGLKRLNQMPAGIQYQSGDTKIFVYQSESAGTGKATCASWKVSDIESVVADLRGKGVAFEHYADLPDVKLDGDIHRWGEMKAAWFKDPDGNILSIDSM